MQYNRFSTARSPALRLTSTSLKSLVNRTVLRLIRSVPVRAARHALFLARSQPELSDAWGYHIRPIHYYEPLPDFRSITPEQVQRKRDYPTINFRWDEQSRLLRELEPYARELPDSDLSNDYFSGLDAVVYYSLIRHLKPRRIIEIGGGYSTRIAGKALAANQSGRLTCIEPYPEARLNGSTFGVHLVTKRVEDLDVSFFSALEANDILFIDSSHTVKCVGSRARHLFSARLSDGMVGRAAFGVERAISPRSIFELQSRVRDCACKLLAASRPLQRGPTCLAKGCFVRHWPVEFLDEARQ
jgi:hypothetical protein